MNLLQKFDTTFFETVYNTILPFTRWQTTHKQDTWTCFGYCDLDLDPMTLTVWVRGK